MFEYFRLRKRVKELETEIGEQKYLIEQLCIALKKAKKPSEEKHSFCRICKHSYGNYGDYLCDKIPCEAFEPKETYR